MKTLKLLGIIAITALIVIGVTGCPGEPETTELELSDLQVSTFYGLNNQAYATKQITARWNGDADVTYEWFLGGASISTSNVCTPAAAGSLRLVLTPVEEGPAPLEKTITVLAATAHLDFYGVWTMDYTKSVNSAWKDNDQWGGNFNEKVTITETEYYLKSDKRTDKDGVPTDEFFRYTIENWTPAVSASTVDSSYPATSGFRLTGQMSAEHGGYSNPAGGFLIYLKAGPPPTQVSDRSPIKRYYERLDVDNMIGL